MILKVVRTFWLTIRRCNLAATAAVVEIYPEEENTEEIYPNRKKTLENCFMRKYINSNSRVIKNHTVLVRNETDDDIFSMQDASEDIKIRAKFNFVHFVRQRDRCTKRLESCHYNKYSLSKDFYFLAAKDWDTIRFHKYHQLGTILAMFRVFLEYSDDERFETFIDKRHYVETIMDTLGLRPLTMSNEDLMTLFSFLALIKERHNVSYPNLTHAVVDEFRRRSFYLPKLKYFTDFFETLHRLGDAVDDERIKSFVDVLKYKSVECLDDWCFVNNDYYGVLSYALALKNDIDENDEKIVDVMLQRMNKTPKLFSNLMNVGFICYYLNFLDQSKIKPSIEDGLRDHLQQIMDCLRADVKNRIILFDTSACSNFTKECVEKILK